MSLETYKNLVSEERVITLYEICKVLEKRHNDSKKLAEEIQQQEGFGVYKNIVIKQQQGGHPIKTYGYTETQAEIIKVRLGFFRNNIRVDYKKSNTLYLISDGTYTKIGIATNGAGSRLKKLQTGNAKKLYVIFEISIDKASKVEAKLHKEYQDKRLNGEWFNLTKKDIRNIKKVLQSPLIGLLDKNTTVKKGVR